MKHIATITVILPTADEAEDARHELFLASAVSGFFVLESGTRLATVAEISQLEGALQDASELAAESLRRDEKNGLYGGQADVAN